MERELGLSLNEVKDLTLTNQTKNITSNIGEAFSEAMKKGSEKLNFPEGLGEKVKEGLEKLDLGEIGEKAAESALKIGLSKLGIKSTTFNSLKDIFEAVREGDLKKGLSSGFNLAVDLIKVPQVAKTILKEGKDLILEQTLGDELKNIMKKQQNTISRINKKCEQMEEAFSIGDNKTLDKIYKTLKSDVEKVMPIKDVIDRGNNMLKSEAELELCKKLA